MTVAVDASALGAGVRDADGSAAVGAAEDDEDGTFAALGVADGERTRRVADGVDVDGDTSTAVTLDAGVLVGVEAGEFDGVRDAEVVAVTLGDAPREIDEVGVLVPLFVGVAVADAVPVGDAVRVFVLLAEMGDTEFDGVMLPDAPVDSAGVGVALIVDDALVVDEPESDPVGVPVLVDVTVPVTLAVCDAVGVREEDCVVVTLTEPLSDPVELGLAPIVRLDVGVREMDRERLGVELGVSEDVGDSVEVGDAVGVPLSESVVVVDGVPLLLGVDDALAPIVTLDVGVWETDEESVAVEVGV